MTSRLARALHRALPLAAVLLLAGAVAAPAAPYWLRAEAFDTTMPDGRVVRMWGYAACTDATFTSCAAPSVPGPLLTVGPADPTLTVTLDNNGLPEAVSITIPGQREDSAGEVVATGGRIRAFTRQVADADAPVTYQWSALRPGTYLYQSGSHPAVQVQMGLYGALEKDTGASEAYGVPYDQEIVLVLSEIAPDLHDAVAGGTYGPGLAMTSTVVYDPKYFLVNGAPWHPGRSAITLGAEGTTTLLRFLNAGLLSHYPSVAWGYLTLLAQDGFALPYTRDAYHLDLHAGKTFDAALTVPAAGMYPVFDRSGALTSREQPAGGMMALLRVAGPTQWGLTVAKDGSGTGSVVAASAPGGIECGADCTEDFDAGTEVRLVAEPDPGSAFLRWTGPAGCDGPDDCLVTMDAAQSVTATFAGIRRVRVIVPNGGELIPEGSFTTIRWGAAANALHYTVQFSRNGGRRWRTIRRGVVGDSLVWQVPLFRRTQRNCRVRVIAFRGNGSRLGADVSNRRFRIVNVP